MISDENSKIKKVSAIDQKCEEAEDHRISTHLEEKAMKTLKSDGIKTGSTLDQERSSQTVAFEGASNADKQPSKTKASSDRRGHAQKSDLNDAGEKQLTKMDKHTN